MLGKARTSITVVLTAGLLFFLIGGSLLSSFPAGEPVTNEQFAEPGFLIDGKTLYLGSSHRGSDVLSDLVSAAWFNIWSCAAAALLSLALAVPVWRLVKSQTAAAKYAGLLLVRMSCAFYIFPVLMLLWITQIYFIAEPLTLIAVLAFFAFPFAVHHQALRATATAKPNTNLPDLIVYAIRRWAALHMLVAAVGFLFWLRAGWPGDLIAMHKASAVLIMIGDWIAFLPVTIYVAIALCLRLWASILEDYWSIEPIPTANSWVFLPTMLEDQLLANNAARKAT